MLANQLKEDLPLLSGTGMTLTLDERMNIELALLQLLAQDDFEEVFFWGRISGTTRDYYISMAVAYRGNYEFPIKRYFWCVSSNWTFAEVPAINAIDRENIETFNGPFTGEHDKVLIAAPAQEDEEVKEEAEEDKDSLASTEEEKIPPKDFTELDRLAYVVRAIDQDCSVVPEGSFRMTPDHELARNSAFEGLSRQDIGDIGRYLHFRNVQTAQKREQLDKDDALFTYNFLDEIAKDEPKGSWSVQVDSAGSVATIRSFLWMGYFAYHRAGTARFGGVYLGDGVKNTELPFMI